MKRLLYHLANGWTILPFFLIVNITNRCNRRCRFCAYQSPDATETDFSRFWKAHPRDLSFYDFHTWLAGLGWRRMFIKRIAFSGKGEPLMHSHFMRFCQLANHYRIPFTVTTNGDYMTGITISQLQSMEYCREVRVSVYERETYSRLSGYNKLKLYNFTGGGNAKMPLTSMYGIHAPGCQLGFNQKSWCRVPFSFLTMYTDGSIVPCYSWRPIGTIRDSIWTLWNGREVRRFRREAMNGRRMNDADCSNCLHL